MIAKHDLKYPSIKVSLESTSDKEHTLVISPLMPGFGYTMGNSIRRVMLSSVPGYGVSKVRINNITHEYQTVEGVKEDALEMLLNLKSMRVEITTDEEDTVLTLKKNKEGDIFARDFAAGGVRVVNGDLYICHLNKDAELEMEVEISRGIGYVPLEKRDLRGNRDPKGLLMDVVYTPVTNVMMNVDQVRVGDKTDFDKLKMSFTTDGSVTGKEVVEFALKLTKNLGNDIFTAFENMDNVVEEAPAKGKKVVAAIKEEIELPARIVKILEKNEVTTNTQLKAKIDEVENFAGLGAKAFTQIKEYVEGLK